MALKHVCDDMYYSSTKKNIVKKHSVSNEKVGGYGIGGKCGVKTKRTRFWEKKNETKILY